MTDYSLNLDGDTRSQIDPEAVERCFTAAGLRVTLLGTLGKYPGCTHWHLKRGRERGTLEFTLLADGTRAWFSIQAGRTGDWLESAVAALGPQLEGLARK